MSSNLYCYLLIIRNTPHNAATKFRIIDDRYAELGQHVRTAKFVNGVVKLAMNASKDIAALLSYLPFILNSLIGTFALPPPPPPPLIIQFFFYITDNKIWLACLILFNIIAQRLKSSKPEDWTPSAMDKTKQMLIQYLNLCLFNSTMTVN